MRLHGWWREFALGLLLVLAYTAVNLASRNRHRVAMEHSRGLINLEQRAGIFAEPVLQELCLGTAWAGFTWVFYMFVHPLVTLGFLVALFLSGSGLYTRFRNVFILFSLACFAVFLLYPCAPPRMMEGYGFVDLLELSSPLSYGTQGLSQALNPYASMPSVHLGYSLIIGGTLFALSDRPPVRLAALSYPVLMLVSIILSANHLFVDCAASVALLVPLAHLESRGLTRYLKCRIQMALGRP